MGTLMSHNNFVAEGAVTVFGTLEDTDKGGKREDQIKSAYK